VTDSKTPTYLINNEAVILRLIDSSSICLEELRKNVNISVMIANLNVKIYTQDTVDKKRGDEHSKLTISKKYLNIPPTGKNQHSKPT